MSDNSRLFKERLRRELVEKHVRGIERSSLISLKFQERLIENEGKLDDEVRLKIRSFLRPCDLEEISIERCGKGKCGWIQCKRRVPEGSLACLKSKWTLDKGSGQIIDRSILNLFCSTKCYYAYLDLSISLPETHPHLRVEVLADIQEWLRLDHPGEQADVGETAVKSEKESGVADKTSFPRDFSEEIPSNGDSGHSQEGMGKDQEVSGRKEEKAKEGAESLENLLESIKAFRITNTQHKSDKIVKQFDYMNIEESESKNSADSIGGEGTGDHHGDHESSEKTKFVEIQAFPEDDQIDQEELDDPEYTYQDMMQVLRDASDDYEEDEDDYQVQEEKGDKGGEKKSGKGGGGSQDYVLLMTQFYDNLSPEVVVLDLLTSLISEKTREFVKSEFIMEQIKNDKTQKNSKESELDAVQIARRNVLKENLSGYITCVEWISHAKLLVFIIYRVLDTFIFPFSIPNLKQPCLEFLTFVLVDVIADHVAHLDSLQDEVRTKAEKWIAETKEKYDASFINNIKLLFTNKD